MENDLLSLKNDISSLLSGDINDETDKLINDKLSLLEKIEVTIPLLQETGIGIVINKISKMKDKLAKSSSIAGSLRKKWMDIVKNESKVVNTPVKNDSKDKTSLNHDENESNELNNNKSKEDNVNNKSKVILDDKNEETSSKSNVKKRKEADNHLIDKTNVKKPKFEKTSEDYQRQLRIKEKIYKYFINDSDLIKEMGIGNDTIESVADEISYEIVSTYGSDLPLLRKTLKTYYYAFGDKKNVQLRRRMLSGEISAKELLQMPESDLANPDVQIERQRLEKEHSERRMPIKKTATSNYHCKQCGKNETTHFQKQTRSADEPMTTFIECIHCGNRWRH